MAAVTLGLGARNLKDTDYFSKSDPFVVVSKPTLSGGFEVIRQSETKNNTLNPDWTDLYFKVDEICNGDITLNIKFEVYDDDGKKGLDSKDKLIGQGFFSLKHLESAYNVHSNLALLDGKNNKKNKGSLAIRTFKYHNVGENANVGAGKLPSYHQQAGGYPAGPGAGTPGYPGSTGPAPSGYPSAQAVMRACERPAYNTSPAGGYPPAPGGVPGYPAAPGGGGSGYPPATGGPGGYPPAPGGYGYPQGHQQQPALPGYPGVPGAGGGMGYPGSQSLGGGGLFPDSQLPPGPGYR
jgi:hypothetical protein